MIDLVIVGGGPVSYTHLDVYKRQPRLLLSRANSRSPCRTLTSTEGWLLSLIHICPDAGANNQQKPGDDGVVDADFKEV